MAANLDSSLLAPSESSYDPSIPSITTQTSRKRTSPIYDHTREAHKNEPQKLNGRKAMYCKYCVSEAYGIGVTTNLQNHLRNNHQIVVQNWENYTKTTAYNELTELYT